MTDENESQGADAAEAFEAMRGELALLRRAVEGLAAERGAIDVPDYTETLGRMQKGVDATTDRIAVINDVIARSPALAMTPEQMAQRIAAAGNAARREDQAALATGRKGLEDVTRQLHGLVASARHAGEQNRRLAWSAIGGVAIGMVLWAVGAGVVARAVPESWLWPEKMAARSLRLDTWTASRRLAAVSQPGTWNTMVAGGVIVQENRKAIDDCRKAAARADEPVRCTVKIGPEQR
ncbi:DUF6118 family protein [Sphingomonas paucimobilis]|uniref:Uncharacterized protein n=1 Tax=Sphingomonas paucimobilis TaxID=13689 RepID=A0A7Y2PCT5_SPHPI|nr:DUF6118 family protein [Sphingomonas paucimobilis]NNG57128.1 hypothetical protein [Sphingomonas paucimobilis]